MNAGHRRSFTTPGVGVESRGNDDNDDNGDDDDYDDNDDNGDDYHDTGSAAMSEQGGGYVREVDYTFGYYQYLSPARLRQLFLHLGWAAPEVKTACELGFGQGVSVNMHAAASGIQWFGTDFNASQAAFARELAAASGSGAQLFDQDFHQFCQRSDLPDFDFIGIHGIWSWVSNETRAILTDFLKRKLRNGGVLYISYNTQPGWASMGPMRELMAEYRHVMCAPGQGMLAGVEASLAFAEKVVGASTLHGAANPHMVARMRQLKTQNRNYLAHEFFNQDWVPMSFSRISAALTSANLTFAGSADFLDQLDDVNLTAEHQALLAEIPDATFRQTVRDWCINQQFRRDYWIKGPRQLESATLAEEQRALRFILAQPRADVSLKVAGSLGEGAMRDEVYGPVLDALADHTPKSVRELEALLVPATISYRQLCEVLLVLSGSGTLAVAQDDANAAKAREPAARLNEYLCKMARSGDRIAYLVSPVAGAGVSVSRFAKLFMLARAEGKTEPAEWAAYAWDVIAAQGEQLVNDGVAVEGAAANLEELTRRAEGFAKDHLPVFRALGIA